MPSNYKQKHKDWIEELEAAYKLLCEDEEKRWGLIET